MGVAQVLDLLAPSWYGLPPIIPIAPDDASLPFFISPLNFVEPLVIPRFSAQSLFGALLFFRDGIEDPLPTFEHGRPQECSKV